MKKRFTSTEKKYECRIETCYAEDWMSSVMGFPYADVTDVSELICDNCPFIAIVNKLAEYEDKEEEEEGK